MLVCPFKKHYEKEEFTIGHKTSTVKESFLPCDLSKCMAYDENKHICKLLGPSTKSPAPSSARYPSENPFCTYGLG